MAEEKQTKQGKEEKTKENKTNNDEKKDQGFSNPIPRKVKEEVKAEAKTEQKPEEKIEIKNGEKEEETKAEKKKPEVKRKYEALVYGRNAPISTKHAIAICRAIKNKKINGALKLLEDVVKKKWAIAFKGEIPHRKGMASGRYPINASQYFIKLVKSLGANAENTGIDTEAARIYFANANWASRPHKKGGSMKSKRTHVLLKLK